MKVFVFIYTLLFKLFFLIKNKIWIKGHFMMTIIKGAKNNNLYLSSQLYNTHIIFRGIHNTITIKSNFNGNSINIIGNNNRLIIGEGCRINGLSIWIRGDNAEIVIGNNVNIRPNGKFVCHGDSNYIHIGDHCLFSSEVNLWNSDTHTIIGENGAVVNASKPIVIDEHVWLGRQVSVLKGVRIGKDSIVGMSSLVSKSIPPSTISVGMPAKVIRRSVNWSISFVKDVEEIEDYC